MELAVPVGGVSNYDIFLKPVDTQVTGIVTDSGTGNPICGVEVWAETSEGGIEIVTDVNGSFVLPDMPEKMQICAHKYGYMASCSNTLIVSPSGISNYSLSLTTMDAQITGTVTASEVISK